MSRPVTLDQFSEYGPLHEINGKEGSQWVACW